PRSQWPRSLQGGTGLQLAAAVRFLGLFDGDRPTAAMRRVGVKGAAARRAALATLVRDVYGPRFVDNLQSASLQAVGSRRRSRGTANPAHRRGVSFFLRAARAGDVALADDISTRARLRRATGARGKAATATPRRGRPKAGAAQPVASPAARTE